LSPRLRAGLATLLVGAAAYLGLYLLLTAEDRRENAALLQLHGASLLDAPSPGDPPDGEDAAAVSRFRQAAELRRDRETYERRRTKVSTMAIGLFGAFAVQAGATAFVVVRGAQAERARANVGARVRAERRAGA
jgi:hypothetical protein